VIIEPILIEHLINTILLFIRAEFINPQKRGYFT
jgi:hypothetical protein